MPEGCNTDMVTVWENSVDPYPYTNIDPYVTVSNIKWVSPTETIFTVKIAKDALTEYDAVDIRCYGACGLSNDVRFGAVIQPASPVCPIPSITAVTPNIWFAGKPYKKVTITGSGFTNTQSCPAPQINMYDVNGSQIPFSDAKVISATEMIAHKVAPQLIPLQKRSASAREQEWVHKWLEDSRARAPAKRRLRAQQAALALTLTATRG